MSGWVEAAAQVRPAVHSVWGSKEAVGGRLTAFAPLGTAFAIVPDGVLLTNAHVVARPDSVPFPRLHVLVQTDTGSVLFPATIVALDPHRDLALVQIADTLLTPVRWAERRVPMGSPVATIGYGLPEGGIIDTAEARVKSQFTVFRRFTAGYSSGYRTLTPGDASTNVLEVDLFLFPGVSGGPVFGADGRVVGVNRGYRQFRDEATPYGHVVPRLVVGQFLEREGRPLGVDTLRVFRGGGGGSPGSGPVAAPSVVPPQRPEEPR